MNAVLTQGKHRGKTIGDAIKVDPKYSRYLLRQIQWSRQGGLSEALKPIMDSVDKTSPAYQQKRIEEIGKKLDTIIEVLGRQNLIFDDEREIDLDRP